MLLKFPDLRRQALVLCVSTRHFAHQTPAALHSLRICPLLLQRKHFMRAPEAVPDTGQVPVSTHKDTLLKSGERVTQTSAMGHAQGYCDIISQA
ncbi:hypothetical protein DUI87_08610 [Hirundo rustica rustica]|uniref:Uncharacterized protein n=1 Tax=Hirundo rustica rustica TaxID=333673 RepID=A0A3M0KQC7_HIRRU|nr:hypothetical protein DUI87_08610 [Hirundo rustica rustica]